MKSDINSAYQEFLKIFTRLYDKNCPLVPCTRKGQNAECPWITKGLLNACKKKNSLSRVFIRKKTKEAESKYKTYKNKLTHILRNSKKEYYKKMLDDNRNDIKGIWNILNGVIKNGSGKMSYPNYFMYNDKEEYDMDVAANNINRFFVNVGPDLAREIPDQGRLEDVGRFIERNQHLMFLTAVDEREIIEITTKCKNKKSTDCDDIDMVILKKVITCIAKPLSYIYNLLFQSGTFLHKMKIAKVVPLFKTGNKHLFTNYRPFSLLPQFSKILEELFDSRLEKFIDKYPLLTDRQYGFRKRRSTSLAILDSIEHVTSAIDQKAYATGLFIDLKKAFDTIDHKILIKKLELYGIRGVVLDWVSSYLDNRKQYVQLGDSCSSCLDIVCGVPQESVLGPKLFILYINDICNVSDVLKPVLFANDTNIFCSGHDLKEVLSLVNSEMIKLKSWFNINKLSLDLSKTKKMLFGNGRKITRATPQIDGVDIERVTETKFLGVIIDENLNWKPHIKYLQSKVSKTIAVLNKEKQVLDNNSLHILYSSLVSPYLTYCADVWGNTFKSSLQSLFILQKRAVRVINKVGYRDHTHSLFLQSKLLKLTDQIEYQTAQIMFKAKNNQLPGNIQGMFSQREGKYNLRGLFYFKNVKVRTTRKSFCVSVYGVKLWNCLNEELKQCPNIEQFKKKYKNMIFKRYEDASA